MRTIELSDQHRRVLTDWITALRSGEYHQGKYALSIVVEDDIGEKELNCCLGVVCQVLAIPRQGEPKYFVDTTQDIETGTVYSDTNAYEYCFTHIQDRRLDTESMSVSIPDVMYLDAVSWMGDYGHGYNKPMDVLINLNDDGATFEDIARILEHCLTRGEFPETLQEAKVWLRLPIPA